MHLRYPASDLGKAAVNPPTIDLPARVHFRRSQPTVSKCPESWLSGVRCQQAARSVHMRCNDYHAVVAPVQDLQGAERRTTLRITPAVNRHLQPGEQILNVTSLAARVHQQQQVAAVPGREFHPGEQDGRVLHLCGDPLKVFDSGRRIVIGHRNSMKGCIAGGFHPPDPVRGGRSLVGPVFVGCRRVAVQIDTQPTRPGPTP